MAGYLSAPFAARTARYKQELKRIKANAKQSDKFKQTARQIGADESETAFKDKLRQIATTTARLQAAGAILLGKLSMHEFALGGPDPTCGFPLARNPWNLDHIPGGSSSGSAAAAGSMPWCLRNSRNWPPVFVAWSVVRPCAA